MSEDLIEAAIKLQTAAREYRAMFIKEKGKKPMIWLRNDETHEGVILTEEKYYTDKLISVVLSE